MLHRVAIALVACLTFPAVAADQPQPAVTLAVSAADFEFQGDWVATSDQKVNVLLVTPAKGRKTVHPAATAVEIPRAATYRLWVATRDYPEDRPGTRTFSVSVGGKAAERPFGATGNAAYGWQDGGSFELAAGRTLITVDNPKPFARVAGVLLTTNLKLKPTKMPGQAGVPTVKPVSLAERVEADRVTFAGPPTASLATESARIEFTPATRNDQATVALRAKTKSGQGWVDAPADPAAEGYFVVLAPGDAKMTRAGFYPTWTREAAEAEPVTVGTGGASVVTLRNRTSRALFDAGRRVQFRPTRATVEGEAVHVEFAASPAGELRAVWRVAADGHSFAVSMTLTPAADGQVALGYELFLRRSINDVAEVLLPMLYQRRRIPDHATTLLDNCTPTPISLVQAGEVAHALAITGEPADLPFAWPDGRNVHFGLAITDAGGLVHPSIWGPVIGTPAAVVRKGQPVTLRFRVIVQAGDWYAGYRTAADGVFGLRDYRSNVSVSMTDAALNMIDLVMDDAHGGWWDRAKAWYQIESKNGSTHASPMTLMSLYRLTGDERMYRRRALPTIEYMLSRDGPHFSPVPGDSGGYPVGSMNGPPKLFGSSTYAGLWELTGRRTPALGAIALSKEIRPTAGYSHAQAFDEHLARYELTGDQAQLDLACRLADQYVAKQVATPPGKDLGHQPFFYISFVPNFEGLLRLYEVTGRKAYLDAAAFGARQLMTGVWTQPWIPAGDATVHPGNTFVGDTSHPWWRGPEPFRLGWPPAPGAITEHVVPAWTVSAVGIGFEQPVTFNPAGAGRMMFETAWAPHFLRLYRYTGDAAFQTYARNTAVGRWGNYPGYYITGHTDLPQSPRRPIDGPDVTDFYYHHLPAHLAWTIDYLVSEAELLSEGRIAFPSLRQYGYAYFDSRIFGHAPGKVFDEPAARLLFRRGVVTVDNVQANYLLARSARGLQIILMNQSAAEQRVTVTVPAAPGDAALLRLGTGEAQPVQLKDQRVSLALPSRGLAVLTVPGMRVDGPRDVERAAEPGAAEVVTIQDPVAATRAAAIQSDAGGWDAFIWSSASAEQARSATLRYRVGDEGPWQTMACGQYPFEFSLPMQNEAAVVRFKLDLTRPDGANAPGAEVGIALRGMVGVPAGQSKR